MNSKSNIEQKHFIIVSLGTAGDIYPFLNIALTLQQRGNRVTFFCPSTHEHYAKDVGLVAHGIGSNEHYLAVLNNPDLWHSHRGIPLVLRSVNKESELLLEAFRTLPKNGESIVVAHPLAVSIASMARSLGFIHKVIGAYLAPSNLRTIYDPMMVGPLRIPRWIPENVRKWIWKNVSAHFIDPAALPGLNAVRETHGLPSINSFIDHMYSAPDLSLTLFPSWFAQQQPDWPRPMVIGDFQLYDPTPDKDLSPELNRFLAGGDAPIIFTPGTGNRHAARYFAIAMEICVRLRKRAIFLTAYRDQVPRELPQTILWQSYIPLRMLLPHVSLIVHHGGIGTVAEALRAGIPQLVVPLAHDQFDNGVRIQSLGVGDVLILSRLRIDPFLKKIKTLLSSNEIAQRCKSTTNFFSQDGNTVALCNAIESA